LLSSAGELNTAVELGAGDVTGISANLRCSWGIAGFAIGHQPDHLERGCIGMSAGLEKSISKAIGLWRIPGRRLQKMVWTDIPMQLR
jgi:hypothetical protein